MSSFVFCETERLVLRSSDRSMAKGMLDFALRNIEHLEPWQDIHEKDFYTLQYQKWIVAQEKKMLKAGTALDIWLLYKNSEKIIGKITVFGILNGNASGCMIGYSLDKDEVGKGLMSEAIKGCEEFLFNELNFHRIEINILPRNTRSLNVAKRCGYTYEGTAKGLMRVNGEWEDHERYAKINPTFKE